MNKPLEPVHVRVYGVVKPGVDPATVNVVPNLVKLGWKFAEMSTEELIDHVQTVDNYIKALDKWVETGRGILKGRLPEPEIGAETVTPGKEYEAHYVKSARTALSTEKVKAFAGDKYPELCQTTEVLTLKIKPITSSV
jgi:hypothetical protein